jgi:hypothetical protein
MKASLKILVLVLFVASFAIAQTHSVTLTWSQGSQPTGETVASTTILRSPAFTSPVTVPPATLTYTDTAVTVGTSYSYTLENIDSKGNVSGPAMVSVTIPGGVTPPPPPPVLTQYIIQPSINSMTPSGAVGGTIAPQTFVVKDSSPTSETFTASSDQPWIKVTQSKPATSPPPSTSVTVAFSSAGLPAGINKGNVILTMPNQNSDTFTNSPLSIPVILTLTPTTVNPSYTCTPGTSTTTSESVAVNITNFDKGQSITISCVVTHP